MCILGLGPWPSVVNKEIKKDKVSVRLNLDLIYYIVGPTRCKGKLHTDT